LKFHVGTLGKLKNNLYLIHQNHPIIGLMVDTGAHVDRRGWQYLIIMQYLGRFYDAGFEESISKVGGAATTDTD
jgi:hypothetical protein